MNRAAIGMLWLLVLAVGKVSAHPLAPSLLEMRETQPEQWSVLWRTSSQRARLQDVAPVLPANCRQGTSAPAVDTEAQAVAVLWNVHCPGGLVGQALRIEGLERSPINVIIRIEPLGSLAVETLLDARTPHFTVPPPSQAAPVLASYFGLGVEHLLGGFDHLLFVGALLLLVVGWRALLMTITAFTAGHSLTLVLATLGYLRIAPPLAELGIALSLLVLACELARPNPQAWLRRKPWQMAGAFGLLHGLGFAGALADAGLPSDAIPMALLGFNLGIEAGQLGVVALLLALHGMLRRPLSRFVAAGAGGRLVMVYAIGSLAAYWCLERAAVAFS